jgi:hypothetical protein
MFSSFNRGMFIGQMGIGAKRLRGRNDPVPIIQRKNELKSYRSFKHFSEQEFLKELQGMNFNNISKHEDLDEAY